METRFFQFTDESLILNFKQEINFGQRKELLKVISSFDIRESKTAECHTRDSTTEISLNTMVCFGTEGYIDGDGKLQPFSSDTPASAPLVSPSILQLAHSDDSSLPFLKRPEGGVKRRKNLKGNPEEVQPMNILEILNKSHVGRGIVKFVKEKKIIDLPNQIQLMRIIYEHVCAENSSPLKYYPTSDMKVSIAKGIVNDLPELEDPGECKWASWLVIVSTKFATVQATLPSEKKRNKKRGSSRTSSPSESPSPSPTKAPQPKRGPRGSTSSTSSASLDTSSEVEIEDELASQKCMMNGLLPSTTNKKIISSAISSTYRRRRKWILESKPSFTDICGEYKHLISYDGDMIMEEMSRIEPLCNEQGILKFSHMVPAVLLYAQRKKPALLQEIAKKFSDETIQAIYFVQCSLPVTLNLSTATEMQLDHYRHFKHVIDKFPTSSLIQIAPENTCVESYTSIEYSSDRPPTPLNPYLLWLTNDRNSGDLYLKIDKKSVPVAHNTQPIADKILKGLTILCFSHYAFNLDYHVYLKNFWNFLESLCGLGNPVTSVTRLRGALRQLSLELNN